MRDSRRRHFSDSPALDAEGVRQSLPTPDRTETPDLESPAPTRRFNHRGHGGRGLSCSDHPRTRRFRVNPMMCASKSTFGWHSPLNSQSRRTAAHQTRWNFRDTLGHPANFVLPQNAAKNTELGSNACRFIDILRLLSLPVFTGYKKLIANSVVTLVCKQCLVSDQQGRQL